MRHVTKYPLSEDCGRQNNLNGRCGNCSAVQNSIAIGHGGHRASIPIQLTETAA
jgi:hypothetical protein